MLLSIGICRPTIIAPGRLQTPHQKARGYSVWPLAGPVRVLAGQRVLMSVCGSLGRYVLRVCVAQYYN